MKLSPSIGALGKVPSHDEFLRVHASGGAFAAFDTWMLENLAWASSRGNRAWDDAFRQGGVQAFVFRPPQAGPSDPLLVGALGPSADRYGRLFPFAVAAELYPTSMLLGSPASLPVVLEDFWTQASDLVLTCSRSAIHEIEDRLAGTRAQFDADPQEALAPYHEWTRSLALADLFDLISLGGPHGSSSRAIRWLRETVRPYQRTERPRTPLTLRLPLGQAGGAAVCFWLDLVQRLTGWLATIPSFFWSHDGTNGTMLLHLGDPPRVTLAELWMSSPSRNEICDLTTLIRPEQLEACAPLPAPLDALLADARGPLSAFLGECARGSAP